MYPQGYICLSKGEHLRLAIDEKNILHIICFQISINILVSVIFQKSFHSMLIVIYIYE